VLSLLEMGGWVDTGEGLWWVYGICSQFWVGVGRSLLRSGPGIERGVIRWVWILVCHVAQRGVKQVQIQCSAAHVLSMQITEIVAMFMTSAYLAAIRRMRCIISQVVTCVALKICDDAVASCKHSVLSKRGVGLKILREILLKLIAALNGVSRSVIGVIKLVI